MIMLRRMFWIILLWTIGLRNAFKDIVIKGSSCKKQPSKNLDNALHRLLEYTDHQAAFYRGSFSQLLRGGKENLTGRFTEHAPILEKTTLKKHGADILSDPYRLHFNDLEVTLHSSALGQIYRVLFGRDFLLGMTTGGTTGTPITTYKNRRVLLTDGLLFLRGWYMTGWKVGDRMLLFYHKYYENNLSFINALSCISGIKLLFFEGLDDEGVGRFVEEVNTFKPKLIVSFPSYMYDAALTIERTGLKLTHYPQAIEVSGETLFEHQKKKVEEVLRCRVYDSYGTVEFGMAAHECSYGLGMHVYEDLFFFEQDKDRSLVVTRLDMHESPIIRYRVGDKVVMRYKDCPCGRSGLMLKEVEGRIEDYALSPDGTRIYPSLFRQIINGCNQALGNAILESRIVQNTSGVTCQIVAALEDKKEGIRAYLGKELLKFFPRMSINIAFVASMRDRKKFRFIERTETE